MLQEVIDLQNSVVEQIKDILYAKDEVVFKSPTGSGKTYMMAKFMNDVLRIKDDVIFLVSSLSSGDIAGQCYEKFTQYKNEGFTFLNPYLINTEISGEEMLFIPDEYNIYVLPRDLNKQGTKLSQGPLQNFFNRITLGLIANGLEKKIWLIKDECHIKTNNLDQYRHYFNKVINMSATPKLSRGQYPDVEMTKEEAISTHLIKKVIFQDDNDSLFDALTKFESIKASYSILLPNIHPCIIIQISNKDKADEEVIKIKQTLERFPRITWMILGQKGKESETNDLIGLRNMPMSKWREYAKENNSTIDVIIFKMVIKEGWDIPRACMLYQIRDSHSSQLDEQVIGRVCRNPILTTFENYGQEVQDLVSTAYVWGINQGLGVQSKEVMLVDQFVIQDEIKVNTTVLANKDDRNYQIDINSLLNPLNDSIVHKDIFSLYKTFASSSPEIQDLCESYVSSSDQWFKFNENIDLVKNKVKSVNEDYLTNMKLDMDSNGNIVEHTLPAQSFYTEKDFKETLSNWVWINSRKYTPTNDDSFSFDSEAELAWVHVLSGLTNIVVNNGETAIKSVAINVGDSRIRKYLFGKNYPYSSSIKYQYYLNGVHDSYPDFILKDWRNEIHIFEVKSLNSSSQQHFDEVEYQQKVRALKECYKHASRLTDHHFYLPILDGGNWTIFAYDGGIESILTVNQFIGRFN